jgi:hypothetical protein
MAFQQLYYTSCERGLSGYAGYQFNAVTPGVHPEVMREVERLTAYEPPSSVPHRPTQEEIATCPIALRFEAASTAVVANVVYVGADYSMRYGNYFAHALATANPVEDFGTVLPIELWQAPFWVREPVSSPALPPRAGPPPRGRLDRGTVSAFLELQDAAELLPTLVSAVAHAVSARDRSVVLLHRDAGVVAHWIAAVAYLLPPPIVRRMSFTTYHHRPSYCRLHVIGTHPDADIDTASAFDSFYLFDLERGRSTEFPRHPLAILLTGIGIAGAERLWARAEEFASGSEATLDEWYPVVLAVTAEHGRTLSAVETDAAVTWAAAEAKRIEPHLATRVCRALLAQPALRDEHLSALAAAAKEAGVPVMLDEIEIRRADAELERALAAQDCPGATAFVSLAARGHAVRRCEAALRRADAPAAIRLLSWAGDAGLRLPEQALQACGSEVFGPYVLADQPPEDVRRLLVRWPPLRAGLVAHLASAPADAVLAALDRGPAPLVDPSYLAAHPGLHELGLISAARRASEEGMRLLADILDVRGRNGAAARVADHHLLMRLWPGGAWSVAQAREALRILPGRDVQAGAIPQWLSQAVTRAVGRRDPSGFEEYLQLSRKLAAHPVRDALDEATKNHLTWAPWLDDRLREARKTGDGAVVVSQAQSMLDAYDIAPPLIQGLIAERLPELLIRIGLPDLVELLGGCPEEVLEYCIAHIRPRLAPARAAPPLAAALFSAARQLTDGGHENGAMLEERLLRPTLPEWRRRDRDALIEELSKIQVEEAWAFRAWLGEHTGAHPAKGSRLGRLFKKKPEQTR